MNKEEQTQDFITNYGFKTQGTEFEFIHKNIW